MVADNAEHVFAKRANWTILVTMDWQQPLALLIVCATAGSFLWARLRQRSRELPFARESHCGCSSAQIGPKQSITFRARKGGRSEVIIRNQ